MRWLLLLLIPTTLLCQTKPKAQEQQIIKLDESMLTKIAIESSPGIRQIEATMQNTKLVRDSIEDQYHWRLQTDATYLNAKEKALAQFAPVTTDVTQIQAAVIKPFSTGLSVGLSAFSNQTTNTFIQDATDTGFGLNLSVDLMKNLFGKLSRSQLRNAEALSKKADLENEIQQKAFLQSLRKIFWAIVATEEQIKISQGLLNTSLSQLKDTEKRRKSNVADEGDVARSRSQVASRKATILLLEYQRESQLQLLKEQLPTIADKKVVLSKVDLTQAVVDVLSCTTIIEKHRQTPLEFTQYDEVLELVNEAYKEKKAMTDSTDGWDLKLNGEAKYFGKERGFSESVDGFSDDQQRRYSVGLQLNIPLDSTKSATEETMKIVDEKRFLAEKEMIVAKMNAYHSQTLTNIELLQSAVRTQGQNTKDLETSLKSAQKKFNQARLSFRELIADQDLLLRSNLDEVTTKLTVVTTLLDYFSVFNKTPCSLNQ
ncbi:MAG: hypothetical protein COW01_09600 [Bdellovibrionales bacterium CG12_big_fil_rev_8_21_14_0_65_38_15]|nr:MAG: hypothetical protein COW79_09605 [Bdellovibrionales bacterium CG22_combo_CG10-13_8_21_14_all_38_13]PIQ54781.1 MAG: hypothetical protein COW01_09600 [Bdellovibrionales bacterium CG12_big_fil_rev_8_21_14_0_65_38_15]PIR31336.1 MAG: hypothetical protein COV38_01215 [Bdellovibrionales bacterium CG11_big_fil_rev_8_21_14_0_20_38_13]